MTNSRVDVDKNWMVSLTFENFSRSNKHCIQLSTRNTIYISRFVTAISTFRSSLPELFFKEGALNNFAKFTGASSGTGISSKFCKIIHKTPTVVASEICTN